MRVQIGEGVQVLGRKIDCILQGIHKVFTKMARVTGMFKELVQQELDFLSLRALRDNRT